MAKIINVLSLFDGMSCGQIALNRAGIKYGKYYASEIDKHAIKVTQYNYPDTIQLGSVVDIDVSNLEPIDLLIGGSPCFGAGTKVLTIDGYKDIEALKVGDEVLTHNNRYRKVLAIGSKVAVTYNLKIHGSVDTTVTANHPYYARKKESVWLNDLRTRRGILGENEWVSADKLTGKYRVAHINCDIEENPLGITKDEAFIIGRYIADGHTRKDYRTSEGRPNHRHWQLILSIGDQKVNDFNSPLKHSLYKHGDSTHRAVFSNKRLVEIVEKHCGCGAENKFFSEMLIKLPKDILMEVFNGYISGDGCISNGIVQCSSVSRMLAITLQRVVHKLFGLSLTVFQDHCAGKRMLMGREITQKDCYIMRFNPHQENKNYTTKDGFYLWVNAKKFTHIGKDVVYNIEVEEDNSYTANGIVVHNCQSFSFAGKRNGMTTTCNEEIHTLEKYLELKNDGFKFEGESYLFWEYMRILTDIRKYNPNVLFLLENVEMGNKWERVLSEAIGIYGVHINSALVSAQNRKRIFWTNIRTREDGLFRELHSDIPQPEDRGILLKDILEDEVDEKYYLSDKMLKWLDKHSKKRGVDVKKLDGEQKTSCLTATAQVKQNLTTDYVCVPMRGHGENNEQQLSSITIPEATSKGYVEIEPGECFDAENINSKTRRGRKMKDKSNCLMAKGTDFMKYEIYSKDEERKGKERPNKVLSAMRDIISEKENGEWEMAVYARFFTNEVLFDGLYEIISLNQHGIPSQNLKTGAISSAEINADEQMFGMSETRRNRRSSYRQEPIKQFIRQLAEGMQELSQQNPPTEKALHHLWHSSKRFGLLREALSEIQEIWESTYNKGQSARYTQRIRRLTPLEAERLQTVDDNYTSCVSDTQRYKALGNGWTVDVIAHIFSFMNNV